MAGALRARRSAAEQQRDLALMTAYFGGQLAQADWRRMPDWPSWLAGMTRPKPKLTAAEIMARFEAMKARGFDVTIN